MINKVIHYCWFGDKPLTKLAIKCINSWKKYCPDYKIIRWDESNYNIHKNKYMEQAYDNKKWGFVPDYARLDIIYNHGGIYLDTDVELIKNLDELLKYNGYAGFEGNYVNLGLGFGAEKNNWIIKKMLNHYNNLLFENNDGGLNLTPSPKLQTEVLLNLGLNKTKKIQYIDNNFVILPKDYLCPIDIDTGKNNITSNTLSIHHYAASWTTKRNKRNVKIFQFLNRFLGSNNANKIKRIYRKITS